MLSKRGRWSRFDPWLGTSLAFLSLLLFPAPASAQGRGLEMFVSSPTGEIPAAAIETNPLAPVEVVRSRAAGLSRPILESAFAAARGRLSKRAGASREAGADSAIVLNLFTDTNLVFVPEKIYPSDDGIGWIAEGSPGSGREGTVLLSYYQGALSGVLRLADGEFYEIFVPVSDRGEIRQVRFRGYPGGGDDISLRPPRIGARSSFSTLRRPSHGWRRYCRRMSAPRETPPPLTFWWRTRTAPRERAEARRAC